MKTEIETLKLALKEANETIELQRQQLVISCEKEIKLKEDIRRQDHNLMLIFKSIQDEFDKHDVKDVKFSFTITVKDKKIKK